MPLRYVNPAPRPRRKARRAPASSTFRRTSRFPRRRNSPERLAKIAALRDRASTPGERAAAQAAYERVKARMGGAGHAPPKAKRSRKKSTKAKGAPRAKAPKQPRKKRAASTRKRKTTAMARKKLYGAAAASHAKKRRRRRKSPSAAAPRKRRRKRKASARTAAPKRRRRRRKAHAAAPKRRRRRRKAARHTSAPKRRRRRRKAHASAPKRRRRRARRTTTARRRRGRTFRVSGRLRLNGKRRRARRRYRKNGRRTTPRSLRRARRSIRNRSYTGLARAYKRRYRMRSNPGGLIMDTLKAAIPVGLALYAGRAMSYSLASKVPGLNMVPVQFQGTAMAFLMGAIGHFATKKIGRLAKYRGPVMLGLGLNFLDNLVSALAPQSVRTRIGLSGDLYADGLGDYLSVSGTPIDDNMTLSDYVSVNDYVEVGAEEELGATVEEELGLEQELGAGMDNLLGGVQQSSMLAPVRQVSGLQTVPARSFTQDVPRAGVNYDNPNRLYGGVFSGGFGG